MQIQCPVQEPAGARPEPGRDGLRGENLFLLFLFLLGTSVFWQEFRLITCTVALLSMLMLVAGLLFSLLYLCVCFPSSHLIAHCSSVLFSSLLPPPPLIRAKFIFDPLLLFLSHVSDSRVFSPSLLFSPLPSSPLSLSPNLTGLVPGLRLVGRRGGLRQLHLLRRQSDALSQPHGE